MTNSEAKAYILEWLKDEYALNDKDREVLNIAFKALEQRWIPVNEELPDDDGYYRVIEKNGRVGTYIFHKEGNSEEYWRRCAVAWMPESYKAEGEE